MSNIQGSHFLPYVKDEIRTKASNSIIHAYYMAETPFAIERLLRRFSIQSKNFN